ncbi:hypothetical protein [Edwardsiella hoshinae]|uniref:hypothetical protein n=1 Tax=Edwardsiella hoshinae TaxID=93378 RepID=UPI0003FE2B41|nr:hypothetical protein [Edwardsiella hoshinae]
MLTTKKRRSARLWLCHTLLLASFTVNASNEYRCEITSAPSGRWHSPQYSLATYGAVLALEGRTPQSTLTLKSDDQNLDAGAINNALATLRPTLDMLSVFHFTAIGSAGQATLYQGGNNRFNAPGIPAPSRSGPIIIQFGCNGNEQCAKIVLLTVPSFTITLDARLSFTDSGNINNPALHKRIVMPSAPRNEYRSHEMRFIHTLYNAVIYIVSSNNTGLTNGEKLLTFAGGPIVSEIRCVRPATPLTLTLLDNAITFNPAPLGASTPQVKTLRWQASGSGRADIWTMRFTSANATASGDGVLLGGAKVTILDSANQVVPLDQAVTISGTQGEFRLALDARTAQAGNYTSNINLTLTAN